MWLNIIYRTAEKLSQLLKKSSNICVLFILSASPFVSPLIKRETFSTSVLDNQLSIALKTLGLYITTNHPAESNA